MIKKSYSNILLSLIIISTIFNINILCIDNATHPETCKEDEYYNTITYTCVDLESNQEKDSVTNTTRCKYGYFLNTSDNKCHACSENNAKKVSSGDRSTCVYCYDQIFDDYKSFTDESNVTIYTCNCECNNSTVYAQIEFDKKGNSLISIL